VALNTSASPSASLALGWNCHAMPAVAAVAGVPLMTGAVLAVDATCV
jgi:hypothetical protein